MPAFASFTVNDGQATPVAHTFSPATLDTQKDGSVAIFDDRSGGIPLGYIEVGISLRRPRGAIRAGTASDAQSRVYRVLYTISYPILESTSAATGTGIAPAPTVSHVLAFKGEFLLPERSTAAQRADVLAYAKNLLTGATTTLPVSNLEAYY